MIDSGARIYQNVSIGSDPTIEDMVVIGASVKGETPGTIIGNDCFIRSHTVIYAGNKIGNRFQTGNKANIREFNEIGDDVSIGTLSVVEHHVLIGNNVRIHSQAFIPEYCVLEDDAWIGPNVVLTNARYPNTPKAKDNLEGVLVGKGSKLGANSTILPGVKIREYSIIGAGSVLSRDTIAHGIYAGNPAKRIGWACSCGNPLDKDLHCPECSSDHSITGGLFKRI